MYWLQRSKETKLLKGNDNTKYFHLVVNGRNRKKKIMQLEQDEGTIIGEENLRNYITEYYKGLFGPHEKNHFSLNESVRGDIPQVSRAENEFLTVPFAEREFREAI